MEGIVRMMQFISQWNVFINKRQKNKGSYIQRGNWNIFGIFVCELYFYFIDVKFEIIIRYFYKMLDEYQIYSLKNKWF